MTAPDYRALVSSYLDLRWQLDPVAATYAGVGTHDARLGNFTRADVKTSVAALKAMAGAFEAADVDCLGDEIDQTAVINDLRVTIARFEKEKPHEQNPEFHLSYLLGGLFVLMMRGDQPLEDRGHALAGRLREAPRFLSDARATLGRPAKIFTETALSVARGGATLLGEAIPEFASRLPPECARAVLEALGPAREAFDGFVEFLVGQLSDRSDGDFAIGRQAFDFRLHYEHALRETAPELLRYGERLVAELEAELARRADTLAPGVPWRALAERLREHHPKAETLVASYAAEMERARTFVMERGLVAVPDGPLQVIATPSFMQPLIPFAAYDPPGAFATERTGFFYVSVPEEAMLSDHCVHEIACTALHEGFPGHHLQFLTAQAQPSPVRRVVSSPLTVEGWALYCEELMAEEGFLARPEEAFFQRLHLLWRAVRIVLDVRLHTLGMTGEQAVRYMVDVLGIGRASAQAEVARYCGTPGYPLCYAVGRRELVRLRDDYKKRSGASYSLRRFHDAVLEFGGLPVALIRWGMGLNEVIGDR
ncbi:MAG: DUF885 domain-containing protein [Gemmatimonadetes bacterium]|nr:DUF885 domain-containing protein [Gemmatimonadota bacterium]